MPADSPYRTPAAFRSAVDTKLKAQARRDGRLFAELRREFLYQRFLARVFHEESLWVLKGGIGLLTRLPGARHSRDIDLMHLTATPAAAEAEIRAIGRRDLGDHLRFEIVRSVTLSVQDALRLKAEAYTGATKWESFDIDVSCERHFVAALEAVQPRPILDVDGVPALPAFRLYPLVDQIADKVAAMYETHGHGEPSNRYRDLVDLALLIGAESWMPRCSAPHCAHARRTPATGWSCPPPCSHPAPAGPTAILRKPAAPRYARNCIGSTPLLRMSAPVSIRYSTVPWPTADGVRKPSHGSSQARRKPDCRLTPADNGYGVALHGHLVRLRTGLRLPPTQAVEQEAHRLLVSRPAAAVLTVHLRPPDGHGVEMTGYRSRPRYLFVTHDRGDRWLTDLIGDEPVGAEHASVAWSAGLRLTSNDQR